MDSKLLRFALLIVTLFVGTVFLLMLAINGYFTPKTQEAVVVQETVVEEDYVEEDGRLKGSDLSAWMNDDTFFDEERAKVLIEENEMIRNGKIRHCQRCGKIITRKATHCVECSKLISRKADRPSKEELKELIRLRPFTQIASMFNVSDNAIRRWCDYYGLPRKKTEIMKISDEVWAQI